MLYCLTLLIKGLLPSECKSNRSVSRTTYFIKRNSQLLLRYCLCWMLQKAFQWSIHTTLSGVISRIILFISKRYLLPQELLRKHFSLTGHIFYSVRLQHVHSGKMEFKTCRMLINIKHLQDVDQVDSFGEFSLSLCFSIRYVAP